MSDHLVNGRDTGAYPRASARRAERGVPPSPEVAEAAQGNLADVIGQAVAVHLAKLLAGLLPGPAACSLHTARYKQVLGEWRVAVANALAAAEKPPAQPEPAIPQGFAWMPVAPAPGQPPVALLVCFECFETGPNVRPVGLVDASGKQILARG